jgi:hypothetical protein
MGGGLRSPLVVGDGEEQQDLAVLVVPVVGSLLATGSRWEPYRLIDPGGVLVESVAVYFQDLQAAGRTEATLRSYGMDLLRWFRPVDCTKSYW